MLKRFLCGLVLVCTFMHAQAQVGAIAAGVIAKDALAKINEDITNKITMATQSGDFLLEKAAREMQLLLANSDVVLKDNIGLTFDKLTKQQQQFLQTALEVSSRLDGLANQVMSIEQFAAMDLNTLLGQIPGISGDAFLLKQVKGYSQVYRERGFYQIQFNGQAFTQKRRIKVSINGQTIQLQPFTTDYVAVAEIPVELVNVSFDDKAVKRIRVKVESWEQRGKLKAIFFGTEKKVFDYDTEVLLLPKKPTQVELREVVAGKGWSEELYSTSATAIASATGKSGNWRTYSVAVTIPVGMKMIPERTIVSIPDGVPAGSWGNWIGDYIYSDQGTDGPLTVTRQFAHQIHDQNRKLKIEAFYRKPVVVEGRNIVTLKDSTGLEAKDGLEYDKLYEATFSKGYAGYSITFKLFNGQLIELTQVMPAGEKGIEVRFSELGGISKIFVKIRNPYEKLI